MLFNKYYLTIKTAQTISRQARYCLSRKNDEMVVMRMVFRAAHAVSSATIVNHISGVRNVGTIRLIHRTPSCFAERLYTDKHEWVEVNGKIGTIGISQYAQEALGDVVYAQLPEPETLLKQKDECGALESVKAASELYCPVSGKVIEKNNAVEEAPSLINSSCYEKGWLFKVELTNEEDLKALMNEQQYQEFLKTHENH